MATSTTNFGLTKPAYNESADVAVINTNMDTVDEVMGKNQNLAKGAQGAIAIVADGDTHVAITAGQYVYVRNNTHSLAEGLYTASSNVSANANITSSNMTAVTGGGLNALNSKLAWTSFTLTAESGYGWHDDGSKSNGLFTNIEGYINKINTAITFTTTVATIPSGHRPSQVKQMVVPVASSGTVMDGWGIVAIRDTGAVDVMYMSEPGYIFLRLPLLTK